MNDSTLEAFVRARYHQTQNKNDDNIVSFHSGITHYTQLQNTQQSEYKQSYYQVSNETDSFNVCEFAKQINAQDSSQVVPANNAPFILKNKIYNIFKPLVVMIGIEKYKNMKNKQYVLNDYLNVKTMLNDLIKYDLVYRNKNGEIICDDGNRVIQSTFNVTESKNTDADRIDVSKQFQMEWTTQQLNKFNQHVVSNIINNKNNKYDGLVYFISSHMKHDSKYQHYLYDSNDQLYHCNDIYLIFLTIQNVQNCIKNQNYLFWMDSIQMQMKKSKKTHLKTKHSTMKSWYQWWIIMKLNSYINTNALFIQIVIGVLLVIKKMAIY